MAAPQHVKLARKSNLFKRFFETEDGLQILAEMKEFCHLEKPTVHMSEISPSKTGYLDPYATIYNEGKRVVLLHILQLAGLTYADIERVRRMDEIEQQRDIDNEIFGNE